MLTEHGSLVGKVGVQEVIHVPFSVKALYVKGASCTVIHFNCFVLHKACEAGCC